MTALQLFYRVASIDTVTGVRTLTGELIAVPGERFTDATDAEADARCRNTTTDKAGHAVRYQAERIDAAAKRSLSRAQSRAARLLVALQACPN